ncbi:hypothetical protein GMOD_00006595 [Pyrenophora seminiperda CCB06]|uniref:Uncharacterized protein n=1 Tax=Pyrenophora seminiperda CCB06 TaxID=1302712 RepID=A0A3M7MAL3_9PLEO|nr:hypothetical protein GMOD_00006595 [Pyrenophora seminiperda CCB06]
MTCYGSSLDLREWTTGVPDEWGSWSEVSGQNDCMFGYFLDYKHGVPAGSTPPVHVIEQAVSASDSPVTLRLMQFWPQHNALSSRGSTVHLCLRGSVMICT